MRRRNGSGRDPRADVRINGRLAARWAKRTVDRLRRERGGINAINVFPVPDGDTGTNLYHTVRSAYRAVESLDGAVTLPDVIDAMATGAQRGARGNSGLILSVALRGVADALVGVEVPDSPAFAAALELAASRAREAIVAPVDGTMVTVLDAMAEEARERADAGDDLIRLVSAVRDRSRTALRETTGQLPVLRENSVVDAGSSGIVELFDLLYLTVTGSDPTGRDSGTDDSADDGGDAPADRGPLETLHLGGGETGLELVAHLGESKDRTRPLKRALARAGGTSIVVNWPMVHVHTAEGGGIDDARRLLDVMDTHGVVDLRVEDLSVRRPDGDPSGLIALADGPGLLLSLALTEAVAVHSGRADLREVVADLVALAEGPVFILPDSAAAADAVAGLPGAKALRTRDVASVVAAAAVFDPWAEGDDLHADMAEAAAGTRVGAVVTAGEDHGEGPLMYAAGDALTVIDGRVRAVESDAEAAALALVDRLLGAGGDLVTLLTGADAPAAAIGRLRTHIDAQHADAEVVVVDGGQSGSWVVVGVE
ncbi:DAK2 domain-containing protein [Brevibacterium yomogidense]|uniref:Dihydroxyacetone kinase family protein n=1 Tax=Brevibacterium yomogidense TaxID=946573 RepID=A0A1X6XKJ5_9MICO|nr:DAK2 domain-containing protein [Brevibacterium yomogidense]SLM99499.1 Dihydroxyacetone kinase family protein [Brevibacterium yomogidense]